VAKCDGKHLERVALPDFGWKRAGESRRLITTTTGGLIWWLWEKGRKGCEVRLLRNLGAGKFADVTKDVGLDKVKLSDLARLCRLDLRERRDGFGGYAGRWLAGSVEEAKGLRRTTGWRLDLKALNDNKSAMEQSGSVCGPVGAEWEVAGGVGIFGTERAAVACGIGESEEADVVRLLWPTGVRRMK